MIDELRVGARKVDEIVQGTECGINIEKAPHIDAGDLLESFSEVRKSRKLITHA
jgi:translation initiation factor IF-2